MGLSDRIGLGYAARRRPDPRIAAAIERALGDARTVLDVGAGSAIRALEELDLGYRLLVVDDFGAGGGG